jgi:hypothetical protein
MMMVRFVHAGAGQLPENEIVIAYSGKAQDDVEVVLYVPGNPPNPRLHPKAAVERAVAYADARGSHIIYVSTAHPEWWNNSAGKLEL